MRRFTGLANYYRRFVEGYAEVAAPLTALGSPTARFTWTAETQASFDALKLALSLVAHLRSGPSCRPDNGRELHHRCGDLSRTTRAVSTRWRSKLTAAELKYPAHFLELLAVIHSLRAFRHYVLVGGAPRPEGCWSDFDLLTDNQAITWLKTHKHLNMMYVRWLDEIEDFLFKFDVTHLPGARSPTNQLSRRGFTDCDGPAASTGESDAESQQELVFTPRPRRSRPGGARSRPRPMGDTPARGGSFTNIPGVGRDSTHTTPPGAGANSPRCWYVHRTRRCGASARYRHNGCPIATGALGRPLSLTVLRPGTVEGARRRRALQADHARRGGGLGYARRTARCAPR